MPGTESVTHATSGLPGSSATRVALGDFLVSPMNSFENTFGAGWSNRQ
jgi:hypothetical protein